MSQTAMTLPKGQVKSIVSGNANSKDLPRETPLHLKHISSHSEHFISALRDIWRMEYRPDDVQRFAVRLEALCTSQDIPIEKIMKWFYGNCLAWLAGYDDDLSPSPLGEGYSSFKQAIRILPSKPRRYFRNLMRTRQADYHRDVGKGRKYKKALMFGQTLLMLKKGSPQVQELIIKEADLKHKKAMLDSKLGLPSIKIREPLETTYNISSWADEVEEKDMKIHNEQLLKDEIDRIVNRCFYKKNFARSGVPSLFPSFSAHVGYSRKAGGAPTAIHDLYRSSILLTDELVSMSFHPRFGVREVRFRFDNVSFWRSIEDLCRHSEFEAEPVYLREPLKVRTITKGPAIPYWVLRLAQKELFNQLQQNPNFQLIGKPLCPEVLSDVLGTDHLEGTKFLSGDYSQATDRLRAFLSLHTWNSICSRVGFENWIRRIGSKALVGHKILYKDLVSQQKNGQLMGSPVSFIVLCVVNAAVCSLAEGTKRPLYQKRILVNGDDCVMRFNDTQRANWKYFASLAGMEPSPGKCYTSPDWLQMNSDLYIFKESGYERIPFVNLSLASPFLAKGGEKRHWTSYGSCARDFVFGFSTKQADKLMTLWIKRMKPYLDLEVPKDMPWGLPEHFGGLGLPLLESRVIPALGENGRRLIQYCYGELLKGKNPSITSPTQTPGYATLALREASQYEEFSVSEGSLDIMEGAISLNARISQSCVNPMLSPLMWKYFSTATSTGMPRGEEKDGSCSQFYGLLRRSKAFGKTLIEPHEALKFTKLEKRVIGGVTALARSSTHVPRSMYSEMGSEYFLRQIRY